MSAEMKQTDKDQKWARESTLRLCFDGVSPITPASIIGLVLIAIRRGRAQGLREAIKIVERKAGRNVMGEVIEPDALPALCRAAELAEKEATDATGRP